MQSEQDDNELGATDIDALSESAVDLFREGRLRQARQHCEEILRREQRPVAIQILAKIAHRQGRLGDAAEGYEQFLRIDPDHADTHFRLGMVLAANGQAERAVEHLETAIRLDSDLDQVYRHLGDAYGMLGLWDRAVAAYAEGLERLPDDARLNAHLGIALRQLGRLHAALACFNRAVALQPDYREALIDLARALMQLGSAEDAIGPLERAVELEPEDTEAQLGLATAYRQLGMTDESTIRLDQILKDQPGCGEAYHQRSILQPEAGQIAIVKEVLRDPELSNRDSVHCHFALGNLLQHDEQFDEAFAQFKTGNSEFRKSLNYDAAEFSETVDRLISVYSQSYFDDRREFGSPSALPVFVVGMPRSGTTLVDQIISSHPEAHGAGELDAIRGINFVITRELGSSQPFPECMNGIDAEIAAVNAEAYLEELVRHNPDALRITDKLPANYLAIGLIKTLLPNARIVHCERSALDTCVSLYCHLLPLMSSSFDLADLGRHYRDYQRLMAHWRDVFGDDIFTVRYEELVANQESVSKELISYIGLDWDDACVNYWESERNVSTPSNLDVRKPISKGSIDRWQRYESHLQPLIDALGAESS